MMDFARYATHLEMFVEVCRRGSFAATARVRGVAASSVVRRIDSLEADLQTKLFVRSTRSLTLTDAGEKLLARARDVIDRLIDTRSEVVEFDESPSGVLRLSCLPTFGRLHVLPVIGTLLAEWPDLSIELDLTERPADPSTERRDAAIRIGQQPDSGLIATHIGVQRWVVCASPAYLARCGHPEDLEALTKHRRIGKPREPSGMGWSRLANSVVLSDDPGVVFRCDEFEAQRLAAVAGVGVAMLPNWVADADIAAGRLQPLFDDPDEEHAPIQILRALPEAPPKLRVFIEGMKQSFQTAGDNPKARQT